MCTQLYKYTQLFKIFFFCEFTYCALVDLTYNGLQGSLLFSVHLAFAPWCAVCRPVFPRCKQYQGAEHP